MFRYPNNKNIGGFKSGVSLLGQFPTAASVSVVNMLRWYRADDLSQSDGSAVTVWPDYIGIENASGGSSPIFKTDMINGKPALYFNNNYLYVANSTSNFIVNEGISVSFVGKFASNTLNVGVLCGVKGVVNDYNSVDGMYIMTQVETTRAHCVRFFDGGTPLRVYETLRSPIYSSNEWAVWTVTMKKEGTGQLVTWRKNGYEVTTVTTTGTSSNTLNKVVIGARFYSGSPNGVLISSYISEMMIYGRYNEVAVTEAEQYLKGKYNIS